MPGISTLNYKFERIEKKFRMTAEQYRVLLPVLEAQLQHDRFGVSTICNIYYDTLDYLTGSFASMREGDWSSASARQGL